MSLGKV